MVHPVEDGVRPRAQIAAALGDVGEKIEEALPELVHDEHFMGRVAVQKKCLREERQIPVRYKKYDDCGHRDVEDEVLRHWVCISKIRMHTRQQPTA